MIQIVLLIAVLASIWLGIIQDYKTREFLDEVLNSEPDETMYDDLSKYDSLEQLTAAQNAKYVDDGHLFDIEL